MWIDQRQYKKVGKLLATARREAGLNQAELAATLGKPQSFTSSYESGQRRVDLLEFTRIAQALHQDPEQLFARMMKAKLT
jgi:transcriptional regulator with XRE-family HTH domain